MNTDDDHEAPAPPDEPSLLDRPAAERFPALLAPLDAPFPSALAGRYEPRRVLGAGGMATVYLAHDLRHDRDVAVKVIRSAGPSPAARARFLREIAIAARLRHPHIVPLFDSGDADGTLYYVMPYETGRTLRERLQDEGAMAIAEALTILSDVADALGHAHRHGVVHRDVKPDNVLLSDGHALVTDFGVSRALTGIIASTDRDHVDPARSEDVNTGPRGVVEQLEDPPIGTPAYMAPEQSRAGAPVDHRADIYALGVLAYELLAGAPPFGARTRDALLEAHRTSAPMPLESLRPDVPAPLAGIVMRCLAKDPDARWSSMGDVSEQLARLLIAARAPRSRAGRWYASAAVLLLVAAVGLYMVRRRQNEPADHWRRQWRAARVERLTDFPGAEVDAAISSDGSTVAFLADRDSVFDAYTTRIGTGRFVNLTRGRFPDLYNASVRNVGFSGDDREVWLRVADIASPASVWRMPIAGGALRPFLGTAVMAAWSPDGSEIAYHETTPGDPIYVTDRSARSRRLVTIGDSGTHSHHVSWSPDGRFLYFVRGVPPDAMDVWRVPSRGGDPVRLTAHDAEVACPVMLDDRMLIYTTVVDGGGPWLYAMDVETRIAERASVSVEHYLSIAAARNRPGEGRRLVATVSNPTIDLWRVSIDGTRAGADTVTRVAVPTSRAAAPRFGRDGTLYYLASRGGADAIWRVDTTGAREVWKAPSGAIIDAPAVSPDGAHLCVPVRAAERGTLHCMTVEGDDAHVVAPLLDVRGAASWSPDGRRLAIAANDRGAMRVYLVPIDGGAPTALVGGRSSNPVWSPDGSIILYSGIPRGRLVPVHAITPAGVAVRIPALGVDRVGDSYRFLPDGRRLVVKLGGFRRQDLWFVDLTTGTRRRLTAFRDGGALRRFDIRPDGRAAVLERVRENADVVLITLPPV